MKEKLRYRKEEGEEEEEERGRKRREEVYKGKDVGSRATGPF